ncbi:hypothetical protein JKF63_02451 [Porcisia hertigi]|uniref:Uncharacterized protein n=1 Tax=Porcisia hertigi TaxID=2761500 RepID=A0A836IIN0_9TRYP|nr:hypothetical protein JKF63_02451 [Porcisia hertigi]
MTTFDGVALPFESALLSGASSASEDIRWMAFARDLVMQEIQRTPSAAQDWVDATLGSQEEQRKNYRSFRSLVSDVQRQLPHDMAGETLSPISGAAQHTRGRHPSGLLDRVEVATPPVALRRAAAVGGSARAGPCLLSQKAQGGEEEEAGEEPLLFASSSSVTSSLGQGLVSQSQLDGVFFEALLSQELSLALWLNSGVPQEALQCALDEMQLLGRAACEEDAKVRYINSTRFAEQRAYKRRRTELQAQVSKTREKVFALEKLLGVGSGGSTPGRVGSEVRLRACLLE